MCMRCAARGFFNSSLACQMLRKVAHEVMAITGLRTLFKIPELGIVTVLWNQSRLLYRSLRGIPPSSTASRIDTLSVPRDLWPSPIQLNQTGDFLRPDSSLLGIAITANELRRVLESGRCADWNANAAFVIQRSTKSRGTIADFFDGILKDCRSLNELAIPQVRQ